jgi:hypothetical protein
MTPAEYRAERRHIYETRLAILEAGTVPTAEQHNMAVAEADDHIARIKEQERKDGMEGLLNLKDAL